MQSPEPAPGALELSDEQIAWRLYRNLAAELVAADRDVFWIVVAVEDEHTAQAALTNTLASIGLESDRVRLIDANRTTADEMRRIVSGARILTGTVAQTAQGEPLRRMIDLHYDVPTEIRPLKDRVNRYVFGFRLGPRPGNGGRSYRYGGVVHRQGVRWIGQSVLRLPPSIADEAETLLRSWGIPVTRDEVFEPF